MIEVYVPREVRLNKNVTMAVTSRFLNFLTMHCRHYCLLQINCVSVLTTPAAVQVANQPISMCQVRDTLECITNYLHVIIGREIFQDFWKNSRLYFAQICLNHVISKTKKVLPATLDIDFNIFLLISRIQYKADSLVLHSTISHFFLTQKLDLM